MWGTEVPPEHSHTSAPQEVVQGRLPHRSGGPPSPLLQGAPTPAQRQQLRGVLPLTSAPQSLRVQI